MLVEDKGRNLIFVPFHLVLILTVHSPFPLICPQSRREDKRRCTEGRLQKIENSQLNNLFELKLAESPAFLSTLATDISKSSCVTCCLLSRRAYIPIPLLVFLIKGGRGRTCFGTDSTHFSAGTIAHLLR